MLVEEKIWGGFEENGVFVPDPRIGVVTLVEEGRVVRESGWGSGSVREGGTELGLRTVVGDARNPLVSSLVVPDASIGVVDGSRGAAPRGIGKKRPGMTGPPQIDL